MPRATSLVAATVAAAQLATGAADVISDWNSIALSAIRNNSDAPGTAARNLAILHLAMFDAVNGLEGVYEPYNSAWLASTDPPKPWASREAAASGAAHHVICALWPAACSTAQAFARDQYNHETNFCVRKAGMLWGQSCADALLDSRSDDGSDATVAYTPTDGLPGEWVPTPPGFKPPVLPQWPHVRPFGLEEAGQFPVDPPPTLDSDVWASDYELTKTMGALEGSQRSDDQSEVARFWVNGAGTETPPGHWNRIARLLLEGEAGQSLSLVGRARLFALLNMGLADTGIECWMCKMMYMFWRPVTAIHNGDADGNDATEGDPAWTPYLVTPPFPEYTSGHSSFSGCAATILASILGRDNVPFTTNSDGTLDIFRSYGGLWEAAEESGMSRIYGGIHFMSANRHGLATGKAIGGWIADAWLRQLPDAPLRALRANSEAPPAC
jgi:hypothetical protein